MMTACLPATSDRDTVSGPIVDRSVLGEWFAGDPAAVDELLTMFRDSALNEHARMAEALATANMVALAQSGHRLRGVALSMGAPALAKAASVLEAAAKAHDAAACLRAMSGVGAAMSLMVAEVPEAPRPRSS
jgi:HPt (histidine-containing phosphotransfer) domain-containing protein